jgi:hypothetical protein
MSQPIVRWLLTRNEPRTLLLRNKVFDVIEKCTKRLVRGGTSSGISTSHRLPAAS